MLLTEGFVNIISSGKNYTNETLGRKKGDWPATFEQYHCNLMKWLHYKSVAIDCACPQSSHFLIRQPSEDLSKLCYKRIRKQAGMNI